MPTPVQFLISFAAITIVDICLKGVAMSAYPISSDWMRCSKENMSFLKEKNAFLWLLIATAGVTGNLLLLVFIISIPIYFLL